MKALGPLLTRPFFVEVFCEIRDKKDSIVLLKYTFSFLIVQMATARTAIVFRGFVIFVVCREIHHRHTKNARNTDKTESFSDPKGKLFRSNGHRGVRSSVAYPEWKRGRLGS